MAYADSLQNRRELGVVAVGGEKTGDVFFKFKTGGPQFNNRVPQIITPRGRRIFALEKHPDEKKKFMGRNAVVSSFLNFARHSFGDVNRRSGTQNRPANFIKIQRLLLAR